MRRVAVVVGAVAVALVLGGSASAQDRHSSPDGEVDSRAGQMVGFDHDKTTHGFRLTPNGGVIEIAVNDGKDTESRDAIRAHLERISKMFADGDFDSPLLIHGENPPGVDVMTRERAKIAWEYVETVRGGRVVATTGDAPARDAIHDFLRFEIEACRTADSQHDPGE